MKIASRKEWSLIGILLLAVVAAFCVAVVATNYMNWLPEGRLFAKGHAPVALDGLYRGTSKWWISGEWKGVVVDDKSGHGEHAYLSPGGSAYGAYPFWVSYKDSFARLDYFGFGTTKNGSRLYDKLVELPDGTYMSRLEYELFPGVPYTLRFIRLEKMPHE